MLIYIQCPACRSFEVVFQQFVVKRPHSIAQFEFNQAKLCVSDNAQSGKDDHHDSLLIEFRCEQCHYGFEMAFLDTVNGVEVATHDLCSNQIPLKKMLDV